MKRKDSRNNSDSSDAATNPLTAALDLQAWCARRGWSFCFIGGIAIQRWGEPRFTKDADMTLLTNISDDAEFADALLAEFEPRYPDMREFALRSRILLLRHASGVPLDIALGALDFERRSVARASAWEVRPGQKLVTCSAEDLLVHKVFAGRPLDWKDAEGIIARQGKSLNRPQVFAELEVLAEFKETVDFISPLQRLFREILG